uniref:Uncharacterized protein n=1 Tax=Panagrolaimus sp. PS1159 TaxID=55785 RepID=A0AC35FHV0_9BILA
MSNENLVLNEETSCCGIHVITCAKFVALVGIFSAFFSIISAIFLWYYIPFAIVSLLIYAYVLMGIQLQRPSLLLPAEIILSITFVLNVFTVIAFVIIGSIAPYSLAQSYATDSGDDIAKARAGFRRLNYFRF